MIDAVARRVLLVDDDLAEIAAVKRLLASAGHVPILATNATDAIAEIDRTRPDLVVVALDCESGEGERLARELAADLPLVALGGATAEVGRGAVARPVEASALEAAIDAALARRETDAPPESTDGRHGPSPAPSAWLDMANPGTDAEAEALRRAEAALRATHEDVAAELRRNPPAPEPLPPLAAARVAALLQLVRGADYFDVLGVARTCTSTDARRAASRLLVEFAAERRVSPCGVHDREALAEIREVVMDADAILTDDALRARYIAATEAGS
jgi:DNA-binding response OmpR family regulator